MATTEVEQAESVDVRTWAASQATTIGTWGPADGYLDEVDFDADIHQFRCGSALVAFYEERTEVDDPTRYTLVATAGWIDDQGSDASGQMRPRYVQLTFDDYPGSEPVASDKVEEIVQRASQARSVTVEGLLDPDDNSAPDGSQDQKAQVALSWADPADAPGAFPGGGEDQPLLVPVELLGDLPQPGDPEFDAIKATTSGAAQLVEGMLEPWAEAMEECWAE